MRGRVSNSCVAVLIVPRVEVWVAVLYGGVRGLHPVFQHVKRFLLDSCFHCLDICGRAQSRDVHRMGADKTKTHNKDK